MTYKEFKNKFPNKKERRLYFFTWLTAEIKNNWWKFKHCQFINHISFLWHWKNFFFLLKYPFYRAYNRWDGKFCGYSFTEYDSLPDGWKDAFGKEMTREIVIAFKKDKELEKEHGNRLTWRKALNWQDIKEKYGGLRLYANCTPYIAEVLEKYEDLSYDYCIRCGKPATRVTKGYITYICDECAEKYNLKSTYLNKENK